MPLMCISTTNTAPLEFPGLGLKRGLAEDLVVAPYASTLALMVAPEEACLTSNDSLLKALKPVWLLRSD